MKVTINDKEFEVTIARTDEEKHKGYRGVKEIPSNEGMLFIFDEPEDVTFEMDGTLVDIDIIFIDEDREIIDVAHGEAGDDEYEFEEKDVKYVLEVAPGNKFKKGDFVEFGEEDEEVLRVLDKLGNTQMELHGGERIFSRKNTRALVKLAKEARESDDDKDYKRLGKRIFKFLKIQNSNPEETVELK